MTIASRPSIVDVLKKQEAAIKAKIAEEEKKMPAPAPTAAASSPAPATTTTNINWIQPSGYYWEDTTTHVKISFSIPGVHEIPASAVQTSFTKDGFELTVRDLKGRNYRQVLTNLHASIRPTESSHTVRKDRVVVSLKKQTPEKWYDLLASKKSTTTPKFEDKKDPSAGIMDLMRNLYEEGDEEMKRTIAKAWTESRQKTGVGHASPSSSSSSSSSSSIPSFDF